MSAVVLSAPAARLRPRGLLVTVILGVAALVGLVVGLSVGSSGMTPWDVIATLLGRGSSASELIVFELRMPRVFGALIVGACLGTAGALTQSFARNPLASPDILGVTSGASLGAVAAIVLGGGTYAVTGSLLSLGVPVMAALGAIVSSVLIYFLAWRGGVASYRLILVGIGMTAVLGGLTNFLVARARITQAATAAQWLVGSLSGISWSSVVPALLVFVVVAPIAWTQSRNLDVSELGDEMSVALGIRIQRHRLIVIGSAVLLTAAAVSASGPVEFVAFVSPQIAKRLGKFSRPPLVASAFSGACVVVFADAVARCLPSPIPVGIVTAIIGAPYLIWLLTRPATREGVS